jgi:hypothetical protein
MQLLVLRAIRLPKQLISDLMIVNFLESRDEENKYPRPIDTLKNRFIKFVKVVFLDVQKAVYEFSGSFAYLKHHLREIVQIAFWMAAMQKMISHCDTKKQRFIDHRSRFFDVQKADYEMSVPFSYLELHLR